MKANLKVTKVATKKFEEIVQLIGVYEKIREKYGFQLWQMSQMSTSQNQ